MTTSGETSAEPPAEGRRPLLRVENLVTWFPPQRRGTGPVRAVDDVSFTLDAGKTLALVGETGCGKSTIARTLVRLVEPTSGRAFLDDVDLLALSGRAFRRHRRRVQMVFQDPSACLNPRRTVRQLVSEAWSIHRDLVPGDQLRARCNELLDQVSVSPRLADSYPHQLSGGQRQRVAIARALAVRPDVLLCDEPVSSLDASIQAQILNLLRELQAELGLSYLFITHDLAVADYMADRVAVMQLGRIIEYGPRADVLGGPLHPYTTALVSAQPGTGARHGRIRLAGDVPSAADPPSGCTFRTRCWMAEPLCADLVPPLTTHGASAQEVACHVVAREAAELHHSNSMT